MRLHWDHPQGGPAPRYEIYRTEQGGRSVSRYTDGSKRTYLLNTGETGRTFSFRVIAVNAIDERGPLGNDPRNIAVPEPRRFDGMAPAWLHVRMLDSGTAQLSWAAPRERADQINGYRIYRKPYVRGDTGRIDQGQGVVLVVNTGNTSRTYTDDSMTTGQAYAYGVAARRDSYPSGVSMPSPAAYAQAWNEPEE